MISDFPLLRRLPHILDTWDDDALLDQFLAFVQERRLELYEAQEEAILELYAGRHVILNTPTGSGKSLVALAMHYRSLAHGRRSVYTCPVKALVNEKFLALCRDFGPENVGLATGDATVNRDAPILCCTAEILANYALTRGEHAPFAEVIMDEFHYYADRERGVAWQIPLLTMFRSQFLLMSATLGPVDLFKRELERLTKIDVSVVRGVVRPVPLEFSYSEVPLEDAVMELIEADRAPIYIVYFSQNDAAQSAQNFLSLSLSNSAERAMIGPHLERIHFSSPYGKELKKLLRNGIGVHHAGLLPKYRVLVESLAQQGLLKIVCGTDTLGVGVNVPIRTVLLSRLTKYGGEKIATLTARDFHQISGRAGRKGFDDMGWVVAQAPEHVVENLKMERKAAGDAKKMRKMVKRKPPERYVGWDEKTFLKLQGASPEPLVSRFTINHGTVLQVLSRPSDGCRALRQIIADSHESTAQKKAHRKRAWQLFRALLTRKIITILPKDEQQLGAAKLLVNVTLQEDFSLTHTLSLYLMDTLALLNPESPMYPYDLLSLIEAILENPDILLRKQLDKLKTERMGEMKADGLPFEERIAQLEELEYPKPNRDFIYSTFNDWAALHPWIDGENIRPKSIAREMYEDLMEFSGYVSRYGLERTEGVLLRHLSSVHKVLAQTVPDTAKTEAVRELEDWLAGLLRSTDSSLLEEWERLRDPTWQPVEAIAAPVGPPDITRNAREFTALARAMIFRFLRCIVAEDDAGALMVFNPEGDPVADAPVWTPHKLTSVWETYFGDHERILLDPEARNLKHTSVTRSDNGSEWMFTQVIVDSNSQNDWVAEFRADIIRSRAEQRLIMALERIGPI